jgi:hypothetical protein
MQSTLEVDTGLFFLGGGGGASQQTIPTSDQVGLLYALLNTLIPSSLEILIEIYFELIFL